MNCKDSEQINDYIPGGYIMLARTLLDSEVMDKPPLYVKLWVYMLLRATHKKGRGRLARGQLLTTHQELVNAKRYYIGYRTEYPTQKQVRAAIAWFRSTHMISTSKTSKGMIVDITYYDKNQNPDNYLKQKKDAKDNRNSDERPPETPHQGQDDGNSQNAENNGLRGHTGHAEGLNEGSNGGNMESDNRAYHRQECQKCKNVNHAREEGVYDIAESSTCPPPPPQAADSSVNSMINEIQDSELRRVLTIAVEKIGLTRKNGHVSSNVVKKFLINAMKYEHWKIYAATAKYLERECWMDGKDEKYLLGMLRNTTERDYYEVAKYQEIANGDCNIVNKESNNSNVYKVPMPSTYAQAQDAEKRMMINYIKNAQCLVNE